MRKTEVYPDKSGRKERGSQESGVGIKALVTAVLFILFIGGPCLTGVDAQTNPVPYLKNVGTTNDTVTFGLSGAKVLTVENFGTADTDTVYVYTQTTAGGFNSSPFVVPRNQKSRFEFSGNKVIFKSTRNYIFTRYYTGDYYYSNSGYVFNLQLADTADFKPDIRALGDSVTELRTHISSLDTAKARLRTESNAQFDSLAAHNTLLQKHVDSLSAHNALLQSHVDSIAALRETVIDTTRLVYNDKPATVLQLYSQPITVTNDTIDCQLGNNYYVEIGENKVLEIKNMVTGQVINVVVFCNGEFTLGWTSDGNTLKWVAATPPTQTVNATDVYTFLMVGTNIYGSVIQNY